MLNKFFKLKEHGTNVRTEILAPLLVTIAAVVTAPALIVVGILMAQQLKYIDWEYFPIAASAFLSIITMILSYSISEGIAIGFITYQLAMLFAGRAKTIPLVLWVLLIIFIGHFII